VHIVSRLVLLLALVLSAGPSRAGEDQADHISQRWASWFSAQALSAGPKQAAATPYQATLTPTFYTRPGAPANLRDLTLDGPRTRGLLSTTTWLSGAFSTEAEVAANQEDAARIANRMPGDTGQDVSTRMMRLGLTGSSGPVRFGLRYRQAGQGFYEAPDQAVREIWGEWRQSPTVMVRSAVGRQWNNVGEDPTRTRQERNYGRIGISWAKPAWPSFDVAFARDAWGDLLAPSGLPRKDTHTLEAALGYTGAAWTARLASSYSLGADLLGRGGSLVKTQTLTASFHPRTTLTIAPTVGYRAEQQAWSGVRTDQPSVSLAMNYRQSRRLLISALGNFSETRSSDRLIELESIGGKGIAAWDLQQSPHWTTLLSLEGAYSRQVNQATPISPIEDISGLVRLVVAPL